MTAQLPGQPAQSRPGSPAAQPLWCEHDQCRIRNRRRRAVIVVYEIYSSRMTPCCDECARGQYNQWPGNFRLLPVSAYVDWYAEARQAMTAVPGRVECEVISEPAAPAGPGAPGSPGALPAPAAAAPAAPPASPPISPAAPPPGTPGGTGRAAGGRHGRAARGPGPRTILALIGAGTLACWIGGAAIIDHADQAGAADYNYDGGPLDVAAWALILLPFIALAICVIAIIVQAAAAEHERYRAWKQSLPADQRTALDLAQVGLTSAAAYEIWRRNRAWDARLSVSVMGQAPYNQTHAAMKTVTAGMIARKQGQQAAPPPGQLQPRRWTPPGHS